MYMYTYIYIDMYVCIYVSLYIPSSSCGKKDKPQIDAEKLGMSVPEGRGTVNGLSKLNYNQLFWWYILYTLH